MLHSDIIPDLPMFSPLFLPTTRLLRRLELHAMRGGGLLVFRVLHLEVMDDNPRGNLSGIC